MQEYETTINVKWQITIPQEILRLMHLSPGDKVLLKVADGTLQINKPSSKLLAGFGAVNPRQKPENFQVIRKAVENGVAEEVVSEI